MTSRSATRTLDLGDNVNTDDIIPAEHCTSADEEHLGRYAFAHLLGVGVLRDRYDEISAGRNFGCGSSREHAPAALLAAGIRRVRAVSFGSIFHRNAVNTGLALETADAGAQPEIVRQIIEAGGLGAFNRKRPQQRPYSARPDAGAAPMTLAEKLLARAAGRPCVRAGEVVFARVDTAMSHDVVAGPVADRFHATFGKDAKVWDPSRVVFVADHFVQMPAIRNDARPRELHRKMLEFARAQECAVFDVAAEGRAQGICHLLLPERGWVRPGTVVAGTDSHTCTYGAFGCFGTGIGTTDMANLLRTGDFWIRVPETFAIELEGTLPAESSTKDVMLALLGRIGCDGAVDRALHFTGSGIAGLSMDDRMTLANMAVECGAVTGLVDVDETTRAYLSDRCREAYQPLFADPEAKVTRRERIELDTLGPQVAHPPAPDNVTAVAALERIEITKAFIGSCTGGKLEDLRAAAKALHGRRVAPGVALYVVPASQEVRERAQAEGLLDTFSRAGATILDTSCGACINAGPGTLGPGETGIYATNRNFKGRAGHPSANHYLASPRTVAVSAARGFIAAGFDG
jgi:homoaconitate hydratase family protein